MRGFGPCCTTPATMSPSLPRNSPSTASSAMSRRRWLMTCFAAKAAMRPKSSGVVSSSPMTAPSSSMSGTKIGDVAGLAVEHGASALRQLAGRRGVLGVGGQDRLLDDPHELIEGDLLLSLDRPQQSQIDVHTWPPYSALTGARTRAASLNVTGCPPAAWENSGAGAYSGAARSPRRAVVAIEPRLRPPHQRRQEREDGPIRRRGGRRRRTAPSARPRPPSHRSGDESLGQLRRDDLVAAPPQAISSGRLPRPVAAVLREPSAERRRRSGRRDTAAGRRRPRATVIAETNRPGSLRHRWVISRTIARPEVAT